MTYPLFGKAFRIFLKSRKYYCLTDECPLKIFTERYEDHFKPCKPTAKRLEEKLFDTVLELGGYNGDAADPSNGHIDPLSGFGSAKLIA